MKKVWFCLFWAATAGGNAVGADSSAPAVVFTATTKAESPNLEIASIASATVRGWVDGGRGRVEFLESGNQVTPKGSILLTVDGGKTVRLFDPGRKTCRPWLAPGSTNPRAHFPGEPSTAFKNLKVETTPGEPGPTVAGVATRHYRVAISYDISQGSAGGIQRSHTDRVDNVWVSPDLTDPAFAIWLTTGGRWTGSSELDRKLGEAVAGIRGAPLRRVTVERIGFDGRPPQTTTTKVEVTRLTRESVATSTFLEPFPCKILTPEDRR